MFIVTLALIVTVHAAAVIAILNVVAPNVYVGPDARLRAPVVPAIVQAELAPVIVIVPEPEQTIPVPLVTVMLNPFPVNDAVPEMVMDFTESTAVAIATALPVPLNTRSSPVNDPLPS
jgi:hypothetical protein